METRDRLRRYFVLLSGAALAITLLVRLGYWQLDRAHEKELRSASFTARMDAEPVHIDDLIDGDLIDISWRRVSASGLFGRTHLLLDNRTFNGRVGFEVLTPLELRSGKHLLVNRGWIPAGATRATIPDIADPGVTSGISGHLGPPPVTGLKFDDDADEVEVLSDNIMRLQHINIAELGERLDIELRPIVLYLDNRSQAGFRREWIPPGDGSMKHRAYAVQWFAMAAVLAAITLILLIQSNRSERH